MTEPTPNLYSDSRDDIAGLYSNRQNDSSDYGTRGPLGLSDVIIEPVEIEEPHQLDLFSVTDVDVEQPAQTETLVTVRDRDVVVTPVTVKKNESRRAVLGSRASKVGLGVASTRAVEVDKLTYTNPNMSAAANKRQHEADAAYLRSIRGKQR